MVPPAEEEAQVLSHVILHKGNGQDRVRGPMEGEAAGVAGNYSPLISRAHCIARQ